MKKETVKKETVKKERVKGELFDRSDESHMKLLKKKVLNSSVFNGLEAVVLSHGVTAYQTGASARRAVFSYDYLRITPEGIIGSLFFNALKGREETLEKVDLSDFEDRELKDFNHNLCFIPRVNVEEVEKLLAANKLLDLMKSKVAKIDQKATTNRKKLEEQMIEKEKKSGQLALKVKKSVPQKSKVSIEIEKSVAKSKKARGK